MSEKSKVGKILKIVWLVVGGLVALVLLLVLALPLWLGPVVKPTVNAIVPTKTKTDFHLGVLSLNPYTGCLELGDLQLANPANYSEKRAVELGRIFVNVAMTSLPTDTIHVEEIAVEDLFVAIVKEDGVQNFEQIQYNVAGGKEKYEAQREESKAKKARIEAELKAEEEAEKDRIAKMSDEERAKYQAKKRAEAENAKRVVIDRLSIRNIRVKFGMVTIPVPSITLTDLGKKSDGVSFEEMWEEIVNAVLKSVSAVGDGAKLVGEYIGKGAGAAIGAAADAGKAVGGAAMDAGKAVGGAAMDAGKAVGGAAMDATKTVGGAASDAGKAVGGAAMDATKTVGGAAADAGKAVGGAAMNVGKAVGGAAADAGKAVGGAAMNAGKAVGEGAGKAVDAIKGLFD